jgi:hypothetical protein
MMNTVKVGFAKMEHFKQNLCAVLSNHEKSDVKMRKIFHKIGHKQISIGKNYCLYSFSMRNYLIQQISSENKFNHNEGAH